MDHTAASDRCSFCGKPAAGTRRLLPGNGAAICEPCVTRLHATVARPGPGRGMHSGRPFEVPRPAEIKDQLDQYCVGQEQAKKTLAVAVHNHYRRVQQNLEHPH
jgi:ATP-dependent Clp protease ATP-binding subunit ClpX